MTKAIALIEEGQREYESTPHGPEEERLYKQFIRDMKTWKQHHDDFIRKYREYEKLDIQHPWKTQAELVSQNLGD